jgi:hypothetical protein
MSLSMCEPLTANRMPIAVVCAAATRAVSNAGVGPRTFWARVTKNPLRAIYQGSGEAPSLARLRTPRLVFASSARADVMTFGAKINVPARQSANSTRFFVKTTVSKRRFRVPMPPLGLRRRAVAPQNARRLSSLAYRRRRLTSAPAPSPSGGLPLTAPLRPWRSARFRSSRVGAAGNRCPGAPFRGRGNARSP